jgi:hypothetical protein
VSLWFEKYQPGDILKLRPFDELTMAKVSTFGKIFDGLATLGPSYTYFHGEKPVMCIGLALYWPGTAEAWMVLDQEIRQYPYDAFRKVKDALEYFTRRLRLHRVQAMSSEDWGAGRHFVEKLGFKTEGVMRRAGPAGENVVMYARVN